MAPTSVLVCRGCCCGTTKHPDVDHAGQVEVLRASLPPGGKLWTVDCLGPCHASNVVVVRSAAGRSWFGRVLSTGHTDALASWIQSGAQTPITENLGRLLIDPDDIDVDFGPLDTKGSELGDLVESALHDRGGRWSMGVLGAVGEWVPDHSSTPRSNAAGRYEITSGDGSLILDVSDTTRAFTSRNTDGEITRLMLAAPAQPVNRIVSDLGPDGDGRLLDLGIGIGATTFAVRVGDDLWHHTQPLIGATWQDLLAAVGTELVAASPTRVIITPLGRMEVHSLIPLPDEASPDGSHSHLRPSDLELGRELLTGFVLPEGLCLGATFFPSPAWRQVTR